GSIVARLSVRDPATGAKYCLRIDLISDADPRLECPRVVFREIAVAAASAVSLKDDRTQAVSDRRVGSRRRDIEHVPVMLSQVGLKFVANAVIHRQLASHFPTILHKPSQRMIPGSH